LPIFNNRINSFGKSILIFVLRLLILNDVLHHLILTNVIMGQSGSHQDISIDVYLRFGMLNVNGQPAWIKQTKKSCILGNKERPMDWPIVHYRNKEDGTEWDYLPICAIMDCDKAGKRLVHASLDDNDDMAVKIAVCSYHRSAMTRKAFRVRWDAGSKPCECCTAINHSTLKTLTNRYPSGLLLPIKNDATQHF
jgi:hypothetical protein